jgi:hypothetical protein
MKFCRGWFNIYLAAAVLALCGCKSSGRLAKTEFSTLKIFIEGNSASVAGEGAVQVTRANIPVTIESEPILTEGDLRAAAVVDYPDGTFAIQLSFNDHGALVLDMMTTAHKGKRLVVFAQFPKPPKPNKDYATTNAPPPDAGPTRTSAWLAAVLIRGRMGGGNFRFTPDASHLEAERIVRGLNNLILEVRKKSGENS